jgi:integrase
MPKVEKTPKGYATRLSLTDPLTGRRVQKRISARTIRLLDAEVARVRAEWNSGTYIEPDRTTVSQWLRTWHSTYRASPNTRYQRGYHIKTYIEPELGDIPLVRLRYSHCQDFVDKLVMKGLAPNSVRAIVSTLSVALIQAVRRQLIAANPCDDLVLPSIGPKRWCVLDEQQARLLVSETRDDLLHAAWVLFITLGVRRGELIALDWRDVDLSAGTLRIERTLTRMESGKRHVGDEAKTDAGRRTIRLPQVCLDALRRHRARQNERRLSLGELWQDDGALFDQGDGTRLSPDVLSRQFRDVKQRLGLPVGLRLHDLRHSAITLMLVSGVPLMAVTRMVGHSSPATTMSTYAHVLRTMEDQATDRIDDLFRDAGDDDRAVGI